MTMGLAQTPKDVAGPTLAALGRRGTVRPGWLSKLLEAALMFLPRRGRVRMMGVVMAGMTKPQTAPSAGLSHEGRLIPDHANLTLMWVACAHLLIGLA